MKKVTPIQIDVSKEKLSGPIINYIMLTVTGKDPFIDIHPHGKIGPFFRRNRKTFNKIQACINKLRDDWSKNEQN